MLILKKPPGRDFLPGNGPEMQPGAGSMDACLRGVVSMDAGSRARGVGSNSWFFAGYGFGHQLQASSCSRRKEMVGWLQTSSGP